MNKSMERRRLRNVRAGLVGSLRWRLEHLIVEPTPEGGTTIGVLQKSVSTSFELLPRASLSFCCEDVYVRDRFVTESQAMGAVLAKSATRPI